MIPLLPLYLLLVASKSPLLNTCKNCRQYQNEGEACDNEIDHEDFAVGVVGDWVRGGAVGSIRCLGTFTLIIRCQIIFRFNKINLT